MSVESKTAHKDSIHRFASSLCEISLQFFLPARWSSDGDDVDVDFTLSGDAYQSDRAKSQLLAFSKALNTTTSYLNDVYLLLSDDPSQSKHLPTTVSKALHDVTRKGFGKEIAELTESNRVMKVATDEANENLRASRQECLDLEQHNHLLEQDLSNTKILLTTTSDSLSASQIHCAQLQFDLDHERTNHADSISHYELKVSRLSTDLDDMTKQYLHTSEQLNSMTHSMEQQILSIIRERDELRLTKHNHESTIEQQTKTIRDTNGLLKNSLRSKQTLQVDIVNQQSRINQLTEEISIIQEQVFTLNEDKSLLLKESEELNTNIATITASNHRLQNQLTESESLRNTALALLDSLEDQINSLNQHRAFLIDEVDIAHGALTLAQIEFDKLKAQNKQAVYDAVKKVKQELVESLELDRKIIASALSIEHRRAYTLAREVQATPEALLAPMLPKGPFVCHGCKKVVVYSSSPTENASNNHNTS